jgi:hypothetical protein
MPLNDPESSVNYKLADYVCVMIERMKYWCIFCFFLYYVCILCYVSSGIESMARKTGEAVMWEIQWIGLSMRLVVTLRYTVGIKF